VATADEPNRLDESTAECNLEPSPCRSRIGRTGEVQWVGAYAWPGMVVKAGPYRSLWVSFQKERGARALPDYDRRGLMKAGQGAGWIVRSDCLGVGYFTSVCTKKSCEDPRTIP